MRYIYGRREKRGCNGVAGRRGVSVARHGRGGLAFPAWGVGSGGQIFSPASLKRCRIYQNHWLSPNFFTFFLATVSSAAFVGKMLYNSVGFNWLACPVATELEIGSGGQKREGFPTRGGGFQRGRRVLPAGTTTVEGKKKVESDDSEKTVRFIRFTGRTTGLAGPILA